ncbi:MAG TPA: alpha/beta hydrolase [Ohtaekwangia sp.]
MDSGLYSILQLKPVIRGLLFLLIGLPFIVQAQQKEIPRDTTYTVASTYKKLVKDYPDIKPVLPFSIKGITQKMNAVYLRLDDTPYGKRELHADVFFPDKKGKYPALVLIHGGGWRSGDKSMNTPLAQQLAGKGFVVISVEYRLSLEVKYPAAIHDIKSAIRWARAQAKEFKIDVDRIAIGGASAGGQLASLIGATNGNRQFEGNAGNTTYSSAVQAVIDMDGLLDFTHEENLKVKRTENSADVFWLEGFYEQVPDKWREASALNWVNRNTPPFLFINSSQIRFAAGYGEMAAKLNAFGIYNEVHKLEGSPHSYWLFEPWFNPTVQYIENFLNTVFKK